MGIFINRGHADFQRIRNSEYVDKTELISVVNRTLFTEQAMSCVTRCRRFGKSMLSYNDENSLACVLSIAYYYARADYHVHHEYATGKGFADLVMIPRKNVSKPALVVELKKDKDALTGIDQIRERNYPQKIAEYTGDILLVAISYDRDTKQHSCNIERWTNRPSC